MDKYQEHVYMDNEKKFLQKYSENNLIDDVFLLDFNHFKGENNGKEEFESHVQASFIKEQAVILNYVYDILVFAVKRVNIDIDLIFQTEVMKQRA